MNIRLSYVGSFVIRLCLILSVYFPSLVAGQTLSVQTIPDLYRAPDSNKTISVLPDFFKYDVVIIILIGLIVVLILRSRKALRRQKEQLELKNRVAELELKVVKAQMNPHFISNCLAAIQELIYTNDTNKAGQYIAKFSYFLRQVLYYSDKDYITIEEELEVITLNVELEQLRFKDKFEFQISIDKQISSKETLIPPLITQPFVENAIWHGLLRLNNARKPKLMIRVLQREDYPVIEIEDNGVGRDLSGLSKISSKGTKLMMDKIESLNRISETSNFKIQIFDLLDSQDSPVGTKVIIQLDHIKV